MPTIPGLDTVDWYSTVGQVIYILKWVAYSVILGIGAGVAYVFATFNIKAQTYELYGSGKDGIFSVSKKKWNRLRWNKNKTAWRSLLPLMNKDEIEPFDSEFIYPGKQIYAFKLNNDWIPGRINIEQSENTIRAEINPVPHYIRNWQSLTHKKNAMEYAEHNWWDDNKTMVFALIFSAILLAAALGFIYLSYQMAGAGRADIGALTNAIKGFSNVPGSG